MELSIQCVPTTYVNTENKEEKYLEIYIFQVSCPLSLPLLNIPNCQPVTLLRLQTELKYPSKNRRRFTQRYNMTKITFSKRVICALFNSAVEELKTLYKRLVEAQVYYTKKKYFFRNIFTLAHKTLCFWRICLCNKQNCHQSYILACSNIL